MFICLHSGVSVKRGSTVIIMLGGFAIINLPLVVRYLLIKGFLLARV